MKKRFTPPVLVLLSVLILFSIISCKSEPEHVHDYKYSSEWKTDEASHWHEGICDCSETEIKDKAEHTSDSGTVTEEAGYGKKGTKEYKCSVCGRVLKTESIPALDAKDSTIVLADGIGDLEKTYDGTPIAFDKSIFLRKVGETTSIIPEEEISFEYYNASELLSDAPVNAGNNYKLKVSTAATDEWKAVSAEFNFYIYPIELGEIKFEKEYDESNEFVKTDWAGYDMVLESDRDKLKLVVYMPDEYVGSGFYDGVFYIGDEETDNYNANINATINKKVIKDIVLEMEYELPGTKDSYGYVSKTFNNIEGYPGLVITVYPYNATVNGEYLPRNVVYSDSTTLETYEIIGSNPFYNTKLADRSAISEGTFLAFVGIGNNYKIDEDSGVVGTLKITPKVLSGSINATKTYDGTKDMTVTDFSGVTGIYDEDKGKLVMFMTLSNADVGDDIGLEGLGMHYHTDGTTTCSSGTGNECPTTRYRVHEVGNLNITASVTKKDLTLPSSVIYTVAGLSTSSGSSGFVIPGRSFYVGKNNGTVGKDTFGVNYTGKSTETVWSNGGVKNISAGDITIPDDYSTNYKMTGGPYKLVLCTGTATEVILGSQKSVTESSAVKIFSISSLAKDKTYTVKYTGSTNGVFIGGVVSQNGLHPYMTQTVGDKNKLVLNSYDFTAPEAGTYYIILASDTSVSKTFAVTVSQKSLSSL